MSKKALGKGIDALINQVEEPERAAGNEIMNVPLRSIEANPLQPRTRFDEESLEELADSIRVQGIIQPLVVEKGVQGYVIIAGERRFRAAAIAGLSEVPVIVRSFSEEEKLEIALIENIQREDLNPIEEAKAYTRLMEKYGLSQEKLAMKIGKKRSTVANAMRLLNLPEDMQEAVMDGTMSAGHARAILSVLNPAEQRILFSRILSDGLSVREAERQAAGFNRGMRSSEKSKGSSSGAAPKRPTELRQIEEKFLDALGTKVTLRGDLERGRIEIAYYSKDDLERIYDIIAESEEEE